MGEKDIGLWFELTYAEYLTVPRSVLEAMPKEWQEKFVALLEELEDTIDWRPKHGLQYMVSLMTESGEGHEVHDPLQEYRHRRPGSIPFKWLNDIGKKK